MKILFCNITYMNNYTGITAEDTPYKGGSFVTKNKNAHEQWNFLNENGFCYGFVMNHGDRFSIERIDHTASKSDKIEDVTVVWCAINNHNQTVIVGWYEHATVYRHYQSSAVTVLYGIERSFFTKAKAEDCYLLPNEARTFVIGRASQDGVGKGFGQQNYWFAESSYGQEELIPSVVAYLETQKRTRINHTSEDFADHYKDSKPLTEAEKELADTYFNDGEYFKFLPFAYRLFHETHSLDSIYDVAKTLSFLYQYDASIDWYTRIIELEGENWFSLSALPYLYQQIMQYEKSTEIATKLLACEEAKNPDSKHEIYSVIADNLFYSNKIEEAIGWLNKILNDSTDEDLVQHTKAVKQHWISLL